MLSCKELTELVTDYLEGRLSLAQRLQFQMHIGMCRHCRAYLGQMKVTVATLGKLPSDPIPADVRDELVARLSGMLPNAKPGSRGPRRSLGLLGWLERTTQGGRGVAIAGAILLGLLLTLLLQGMQPGAPSDGHQCVLLELGAGLFFALALGLLAWSARARVAAETYSVVGMAGTLPIYAMLQAGGCPMANVAAHVLAYHVGGVVLAASISTFVSRVPALR